MQSGDHHIKCTFFSPWYSWKITHLMFNNNSSLTPLQSQEILNRPVFVLEILKSVWKFWKLLKILNRFWTDSEHCWKFWTDSEHCWKFWTDCEHYWKFWANSEHCWKFWTDSEHYISLAIMCNNRTELLLSIYSTCL